MTLFKKKVSNRQLALDWWSTLTSKEKTIYEYRFFDIGETGSTSDIDIEVMFITFKK